MKMKNFSLSSNVSVLILTFTYYGFRIDSSTAASPPSPNSQKTSNNFLENTRNKSFSLRSADETDDYFDSKHIDSRISLSQVPKISSAVTKEHDKMSMKPQVYDLNTFTVDTSIEDSSSLHDILRDEIEDGSDESSQEFVILMKGNPAAKRIHIEDPVRIGNMVYRLEIKEYPYDDEAMNSARKICRETPETMATAKEELVKLLRNDPELIVPWQNDAWLIRFLRARKYNVSKTHDLIKNHYKFKAENRDIFDGLLPSKVGNIFEEEAVVALPYFDKLGRRTVLARAERWDPKKYSILQMLRMAIILLELGIYKTAVQLSGFQAILDLNKMTWTQVWNIDLGLARTMVHWILDCVLLSFEAVHIVNQPTWFGMAYKIFKPLLPKEFIKTIHIHGTDWESFHEFMPASILPDIYGGTYPMISLTKYEWDVFLRFQDKEYKALDSYGYKTKPKKLRSRK